MDFLVSQFSRRRFLHQFTVAGLALPALSIFREETLRFLESGGYLEELVRTPSQTEGPFYPRDWRGDADFDLVQVQGEGARGMGTVLHLSGRVLSARSDNSSSE